jgi:hypothetical protein
VCAAVPDQVIGRLSGNHKAGITSLLALPSRAEFRQAADQQAAAAQPPQQQQSGKGRTPRQSSERGGPPAAAAAATGPVTFMPSVDLVMAGDSSGGIFLWSPFSTPLGSAEREVAPRLAFSGHSGEVWALCLTPGPENAQATAPKVFSAGEAGCWREGGHCCESATGPADCPGVCQVGKGVQHCKRSCCLSLPDDIREAVILCGWGGCKPTIVES